MAWKTVYSPGPSEEIKNYSTACNVCQRFSRKNVKEPFQSHGKSKSNLPLLRTLIRWLEVLPIANKSAPTVIRNLKLYLFNPIRSWYRKKFLKQFWVQGICISVGSRPCYFRPSPWSKQWCSWRGGWHSQEHSEKCQFNIHDLDLASLNYLCSPVAGFPCPTSTKSCVAYQITNFQGTVNFQTEKCVRK